MKQKIILTAILILIIGTSFASKSVELRIDGSDADTNEEAVELFAKVDTTYWLQGRVTNEITIIETQKDLDLVFILDASGSMSAEISTVRNAIVNIMSEINQSAFCDDCMRAGLYVLEGSGSKAGFTPKNYNIRSGYNQASRDIGAIHLTLDADLLEQRLGQVSVSGGFEPWADLTSFVLNDQDYGWNPDHVPVIIAMTDEANWSCPGWGHYSASGSNAGVQKAINTLKEKNAYFFGVAGQTSCTSSALLPQMDEILKDVPGNRFLYNNTNEIPGLIKEAILEILGEDDFEVELLEGPSDWILDMPSEISNVGREGGTAEFEIEMKTPLLHDKIVEYFHFRLSVKGDSNIYDDAWLKVYLKTPPEAKLNITSPGECSGESYCDGYIDFEVRMNAEGTEDDEDLKYLDRLEWDCGNGQTATFDCTDTNQYATPQDCLEHEMVCDYTERDKAFTARLTVYDSVGQSDYDDVIIQTLENRPPIVTIEIIHPENSEEWTADANIQFRATAIDPDPGDVIEFFKWNFYEHYGYPTGKDVVCDVEEGDPSCPEEWVLSHVYKEKEDVEVKVTACDDFGDCGEEILDFTLANRPPLKPIIQAIPAVGYAPLSVSFSIANLENIDPDGDPITGFRWRVYEKDSDTEYSERGGINEVVPKITETFNEAGLYKVEVKVHDEAVDWKWSDWGETTVRVGEASYMHRFAVQDTNFGEKTSVKARCTGKAEEVIITLYHDDEEIHSESINCTGESAGVFQEIDYAFDIHGFYLVKGEATGDFEIGEPCINCIAYRHLYIAEPDEEIAAPETSLIIVALTAITAIAITGKKRREKQ